MAYKDKEKERAYYHAYYVKNRTKRLEQDAIRYANNADTVKAAAATWSKNNPDRVKAAKARYVTRHPDRVKAAHAKWYATNADTVKAAAATWKANNPDKVKASIATWSKNNLDKRVGSNQKRRALKRGTSIIKLTLHEWQLIKESYNFRCAYCGVYSERLHQEHVIPLSKGGPHVAGNIVPSCKGCNSKKGKKMWFDVLTPTLIDTESVLNGGV